MSTYEWKREDVKRVMTGELPATATIEHWCEDGDDSYWVKCTLKFDDILLNPNNDEWEVGQHSFWYGTSHESQCESVFEDAQRLYDHLLKFRTLYGEQTTIQYWMEAHRMAHDNNVAILKELQLTKDQLKWARERVAGLEDFYTVRLETRVKELNEMILNLANLEEDRVRFLREQVKPVSKS